MNYGPRTTDHGLLGFYINRNGPSVRRTVEGFRGLVAEERQFAELARPGAVGQLAGAMRTLDPTVLEDAGIQNDLLHAGLDTIILGGQPLVTVHPIELIKRREGGAGPHPAVGDTNRPGDAV